MHNINILFDFNIFLWAYFDNTYKTGLYWSEYYIVLNMIENYRGKFNFYAYCSCNRDFWDNYFLKIYPEFSSIKYQNIYSGRNYYKNIIKNNIKNLRNIKKHTKSNMDKFKLTIKTLGLKIAKFFSYLLPKKKINLNHIDIYQSFFFPIPNEIIENRKIKKYIIVHDIIPYTNPEYISDNRNDFDKIVNNFKDKINKIGIDTTIFVDSIYTKKIFFKNFPEFKKNNIIINPLAADDRIYFKCKNMSERDNSILNKYGISNNCKYFLSLSSLNSRKNLSFLVDCFIEFLRNNPNIKDLYLVLAGPSGWMMEDMFNSIKNANEYRQNIIVTGFIDEEDINVIYNNAFTFIFPSLLEGFGLPILEALKCGIPTISSNTSSMPEIYGNAAIEIDPTNKKDLLNAMHKVYYDESLRNKLSDKSIEQSEKFTWKKTIDNMVNEYLIDFIN